MTPVNIAHGLVWLTTLAEAESLATMGPGKYRANRVGEINLGDLAGLRRGCSIAVVLGATERIVPEDRCGPTSAPLLFVAHSADRGRMITG